MRIAPLGWVVASTILAVQAWAADAAPTLTLEQALGSAETANLTVLLSRETVVQAGESVRIQRAGILPTVDVSSSQRRSRGTSITNRFDVLANGNYALFNLQRRSTLRSVRLGSEISQANYQFTVQTVMADIADAYFAHLRNLRRLTVLDSNIARARSLFDLARNQFEVGTVPQIDVTRAESQVAVAEQARLQQETAVQRSEIFLKRLLDLQLGPEMRLADFQVRRTDSSTSIFTDDKTVFERRADFLAQQKALEQSKVDVRSATFERAPTLSVSGNYGLNSTWVDDTDKDKQWSLGVSVGVPIFDAFRIGANRRVAQSRQRSAEYRLHNLESQISGEIRLAIQDASSRNAQVTVAEKSLALAQDELRFAQQRYQNGVADNRELVEAQNRLAIADDNLVEAVYQYNLSRVELARAKGDVRSVLTEQAP